MKNSNWHFIGFSIISSIRIIKKIIFSPIQTPQKCHSVVNWTGICFYSLGEFSVYCSNKNHAIICLFSWVMITCVNVKYFIYIYRYTFHLEHFIYWTKRVGRHWLILSKHFLIHLYVFFFLLSSFYNIDKFKWDPFSLFSKYLLKRKSGKRQFIDLSLIFFFLVHVLFVQKFLQFINF